jgi:4-hydroxy-tetrahydrodipicolinate synthase
MEANDFGGVWTALITPFKEGKVDFGTLEKLVEYQVAQKVRGIVVAGTTGESSTLEEEERVQIVEHIVAVNRGRLKIWVGTGSNSTQTAVRRTQLAHRMAVDGVLVVAPYYNRPNQQGLLLHFSHVAESTDKPVLLYSIPARCGVEIGIGVIESLHRSFANIVGIKESGGSCNRVSQIIKAMDKDFTVLSGDDTLTLPFIAIGAKGVVSVASNWIGAELVEMVRLGLENNLEEAAKLNRLYYPFFRSLGMEPNPIPIKQVLYEKNLIPSPEVRLPLCRMDEQNIRILVDGLNGVQRK